MSKFVAFADRPEEISDPCYSLSRPPAARPRVSEVHGRHLFVRNALNPIITAEHLPYPANTVFNPGAARVDGETVLLMRVEDLRGISSLHVARSRRRTVVFPTPDGPRSTKYSPVRTSAGGQH